MPRVCCNTACAHVIQQTQNICITFAQRRSNVFDVRQTLYKCYLNVLCFFWKVHAFLGGGLNSLRSFPFSKDAESITPIQTTPVHSNGPRLANRDHSDCTREVCSAVQSQNAVTAYFKIEQRQPFGFANRCGVVCLHRVCTAMRTRGIEGGTYLNLPGS